MSRGACNRASDGRRRINRRRENYGGVYWTDGATALKPEPEHRTPEVAVVERSYPICGGLLWVTTYARPFGQREYSVRVGRKELRMSLERILSLWRAFYAWFEHQFGEALKTAATVNSAPMLPAPSVTSYPLLAAQVPTAVIA